MSDDPAATPAEAGPILLPHLVFSTRARHPETGTESNREVIAWSIDPAVPEAAHRAFALRADLTVAAVGSTSMEPIYSFSPVGDNLGEDGLWLFYRAISLGIYRKRSHQLLIHGVVLQRDHLDLLDGNPFLLDDPEVVGFHLYNQHPDGIRELAPLELDADHARDTSQGRNRERLARLGEELAGLSWNPEHVFPAGFEAFLETGRPAAWLTPGLPDHRLAEWLLLHLHPHDRLCFALHTCANNPRALANDDLLLAPEAAREAVRASAQGLTLLEADAAPAAAGRLGVLTHALRGRSPRDYPIAVDRWRLTFRADRVNLPGPLAAEDAELILRHELGEELDPREEARLEILRGRQHNALVNHALALAKTLPDLASFDAALAKIEATSRRVSPELLDPAVPQMANADWPTRWAFAVLLRSSLLDEDPTWPSQRLDAFRRAIPAESFEKLLESLETSGAAHHALPYLDAWTADLLTNALERASEAPNELSRGSGSGHLARASEYWPTYLKWRGRTKRAFPRAVAAVEGLLSDTAPEVSIRLLPRLRTVCNGRGATVIAERIYFHKEAIPAFELGAPRARDRWRQRLHELLARDDGEALLRVPLGNPALASAFLEDTESWLIARPQAPAWKRFFQALEANDGALHAEAAPTAGRMVARLASHPQGDELPQLVELLARALTKNTADPTKAAGVVFQHAADELSGLARDPLGPQSLELPMLLTRLLNARLTAGATADADMELLELLLHGLVHLDAVEDAAAQNLLRAELEPELPNVLRFGLPTLRRTLDRYLDQLLKSDNFLARVRTPNAWRHLLRDEMMRRPLRRPERDPRFRAYLRLSWQLWETAPRDLETTLATSEATLASLTLSLARMLPWRPEDWGAGWDFHAEQMRAVVRTHERQALAARMLHAPRLLDVPSPFETTASGQRI